MGFDPNIERKRRKRNWVVIYKYTVYTTIYIYTQTMNFMWLWKDIGIKLKSKL